MDAQDFDLALGDLETRVDRLRALYENWFRGYEKAEPAVARKDVERKVYAMRKEMPRNTALRFRYNQLYLRYTTLATYWQRTARQIEEGTYRLQHMRIRRRNEHAAARDEQQPAELGEPRDPRPDGFELDMDEPVDIDGIFAQVMLDDVEKALTRPGSHVESDVPAAPRPSVSTPRARGTFARPRRDSNRPTPELAPPSEPRRKPIDDDRALAPTQPAQFFDDQPVPERKAPDAPRPALDAARAKAPPPPPLKAPATPGNAKVPPPPGPATGRTAIPPRPPAPGTSPGVPPRAPPPPIPAVPSGRTAFGLSSNPADVAARIAAGGRAPPPPGAPAVNRGSAPSAPTIAVGGPATTPATPRLGPAAPARPAAEAKPFVMTRPSDSSPGHAPARPPAAPRTQALPGGGTVVGRPPLRSPLAPDPVNVHDQRMKRLHEEFNSARKRNNEGDVRFETVMSSIQKMLPELEKKHAGKRIDFEVVVKDGRVGLKPKAT